MTRLLLTILLLHSLAWSCGTVRWPVKTLADATAAQVNLISRDVTFSDLAAFIPPTPEVRRTGQRKRIAPQEFQVWRVRVLLRAYRREADEDFHISIANPANRAERMIAEIPSANCVPLKYRATMNRLRTLINQHWGVASLKQWRYANYAPVTITGVGFFDFPHDTGTLMLNYFELHPVLDIKVE